MKSKNMVNVQLSLEAFGFTGMNKQEIEAAILTAIQCQLVFTTSKGQEIKMDVIQDVQVENIIVTDEDGYEIQDADNQEVSY